MLQDKHFIVKIAFLQSTLCGSGLLPKAPGTFGSIFSLLIFSLYTQIASKPSVVFLIALVALLTIISHVCNEICLQNLDDFNHKDPQYIVNDEFLGYFVSILLVDWSMTNLILALFLFRFFDILKPGLVSWADKREGSFAIILDDLFAGLYAGVCLVAINFFLK